MADIEYIIKYDKTNGLQTEQHILAIGTEDRIRFVTTPETQVYAHQNAIKVAIKRGDTSKTPFKKGELPDPYYLPLQNAKPKWFTVAHSGKKFLWHCGSVDQDGKFVPWKHNMPAAGAHPNYGVAPAPKPIPPPETQHSLPFPW